MIRWTDPSIPVDGQYNASFHLCDNKFHRVQVKRNISVVELQVDDHSPVSGTVPSGYTLKHGAFHIGGVAGNTQNNNIRLCLGLCVYFDKVVKGQEIGKNNTLPGQRKVREI